MRSVLIIDDEALSRRCIRSFVESWGWSAVTASDGKDGVKKLKTFRPDVVVLNITMPEMDGFKIARTLKSDSAYRGCFGSEKL